MPSLLFFFLLFITSCVAQTNTTNTTATPSAITTITPVTVAPTPTTTPKPIPSSAPVPLVACANRGSCSQCAADSQCSWCAETNTCVFQQLPTICTDRGWRITQNQCFLPDFNPYLQEINEFGTINATNKLYVSNNVYLQNFEPIVSNVLGTNFTYVQLDFTPGAPTLTMQLLVKTRNFPNGQGITLRPTLISATQSYYTIRPTVTGSVCDTAARSLNTATCDFVLQVFAKNPMVDTPIDFKLSFAAGVMMDLDTPIAGTISGNTIVLRGLEFPASALDVKMTLRPNTTNPKTDIDLYVAHETTVNTPQFPDHQVGRGTNAEETFLINNGNYMPGLYIVALVPAQIDNSQKYLEFFIQKNFKNDFIFGLSTLGIIAGIAILVLCIFSAVAVLAKRRRRAFLAAQAASTAIVNEPTGPTGVTPEELELIPVHPFQKHEEAADDDSLCSICLCEYDVGQPVRTLACLHHFHTSCVDPWLKDHRTCPNCRKDAIQGLKGPSELSKAVERGTDPAPTPAPAPGPQIVVHTEREMRAISSPSTPISSNISLIQIDAGFPHSAVTRTDTSSPMDSSLSRSVRRLSHPRDLHPGAVPTGSGSGSGSGTRRTT